MDQTLRDASEQGNVNGLYSSIARDPKVLDKIDEIPFVDTPLHVAAAAGQTQFAMEMMMLKPSFAKKLNPNGFTPLLLAMHNNQNQLVCELLTAHKDLVCAQGKGGMNPLHYAAQTGNLRLLAIFLKVYPKCIIDVTSRKETALHVALKNDKLDAFQVLVGWLRRAWFEKAESRGRRLLNAHDLNGNTVLHIAASKNQPQVVRWILDLGARVNSRNLEDFTPMDIAQGQTQVDNQEMRNMLCRAGAKSASSRSTTTFADYLRSPIPINEKLFTWFFRQRMLMSNDMRNMLLVVAVLLVTIAYQTVLSPPGGFWQDNQFNTITNASSEVSQPPHRAGTVIMARPFFHLLVIINSLSFYISLILMVLVLPPSLPSVLMVVSFGLLFMSYGTSIAITAPFPSYWLPYFLFFSFFLVSNIAFNALVTWKDETIMWAFHDVRV